MAVVDHLRRSKFWSNIFLLDCFLVCVYGMFACPSTTKLDGSKRSVKTICISQQNGNASSKNRT